MENLRQISVIILNHNGEEFLVDCLDSLIQQDYPKDLIDIVVADNGSTDGSIELIEKKYKDVRIIKNEKNMGFGKGNNLAVAEVDSEFVAFLNNDMRVEKDWLSNLVFAIDEENGIVCTGSKILDWEGEHIDFAGGIVNFMGMGVQKDYKKRVAEVDVANKFIPFACGGAMLIKRDMFLSLGGFDEDYVFYNEDVDLGWRLWLKGLKVKFVADSVAFHRHHGTGDSVFSGAQKRAFCDRNALFTMFKNLSDENLYRFLPISLILGTLRIPAMCGIDTKEFFFNPESDIVKKISDRFELNSENLSWIAAVEDFSRNIVDFSEKRREVQDCRVVSDDKIFSLFGGFCNTGYFGYNFWEEYEQVFQILGGLNLEGSFDTRVGYYKDSEEEQIIMQKQHIKHFESIIFDKDSEIKGLKGSISELEQELEKLENRFSEVEKFALKVKKNIFFKIYAFFRNILSSK